MAKSPEAFRSISEAADELGVAQHVLRFWETKFSFVKPMKRAGGRRFYRPADIAVLADVRRLLHQDGYTIKGVQKLYRETGLKPAADTSAAAGGDTPVDRAAPAPSPGPTAPRMVAVLAELELAKARLDAVLVGR